MLINIPNIIIPYTFGWFIWNHPIFRKCIWNNFEIWWWRKTYLLSFLTFLKYQTRLIRLSFVHYRLIKIIEINFSNINENIIIRMLMSWRNWKKIVFHFILILKFFSVIGKKINETNILSSASLFIHLAFFKAILNSVK